jgi:hypothetical protein
MEERVILEEIYNLNTKVDTLSTQISGLYKLIKEKLINDECYLENKSPYILSNNYPDDTLLDKIEETELKQCVTEINNALEHLKKYECLYTTQNK